MIVIHEVWFAVSQIYKYSFNNYDAKIDLLVYLFLLGYLLSRSASH